MSTQLTPICSKNITTDTNKITIIRADGSVVPFDLKSKADVATDIVNELIGTLKAKAVLS